MSLPAVPSNPNEKKKEKKLKKFLDKNSSGVNRFKALIEYIEKCGNDSEVEGMFKANAFEIFSVAHDAFNNYEQLVRKGKYQEATVQNLHFVLRKVLTHLAENIRQRWHVRNITNMIEKSLNIMNRQQYRVSAFELLLYFYMDLGEPEKDFLNLLPQCIDLQPFLVADGYSADHHLKPRVIQGDLILVPRAPNSPNTTKEDSIELLSQYLNFLTEKPVNFEQWFNWYKQYYMPVFYPNVCKQIGLLDPADDTGFREHCPYDVQALFADKLASWTSNENILSWLWCQGDNALLMLEIYRQACQMPVARSESIKKYLGLFFEMLFVKPSPRLPEANLNAYRKWFFENIVFVAPDGVLQQDHVKLVLEALSYFKKIVQKNWGSIIPEIRQTVYVSLVDLASRILQRPDSGGPDHTLAPGIVECVLYVWLRAKTVDPSMWALLHERLRSYFHRRDAIVQVRNKITQMTLIIQNYLYTFEGWDRYMEKKNKAAQAQVKKPSESHTPDFREPIMPQSDPSIAQIDWDYPTAQSIWYDLLESFRYLNDWEDPALHFDGIETLSNIIDLLISAHQRADYLDDITQRPFISLISIFGPWLFEAVRKPPQFNEGRALAFRSLGRIICRHSQINLPRRLLAHFYDAIQLGLIESSGTKVSHAIIESTASLFALSLPGCNLLIPAYLTEIRAIFTKPDSVPEKVRESAIQLLASLICFPTHFNGLCIPVDQAELRKRPDLQQVDDMSAAAYMDLKDVRPKVANLLAVVLARDPVPSHQALALSVMTSLVCAEIVNPPSHVPDAEMVTTLLKSIIGCTLNSAVASVALSSLAALASFYDSLICADESIGSKVLQHLMQNVASKLAVAGADEVIAAHYSCMLEWVMAVPVSFFDDVKLTKKLFWTVDQGVSIGRAGSSPTSMEQTSRPGSVAVSLGTPSSFGEGTYSGGGASAADTDVRSKVRRAAEQMLVYLSNFLHNFPPDKHYDVLNSQTLDIEPDDARPGGAAVASAVDAAEPQSPRAGSSAPDPSLNVPDPTMPISPRGADQLAQGTTVTRIGPVLWYTANKVNVFSVQDVCAHAPPALDEDVVAALNWTLGDAHYVHYFNEFLAWQQLDTAVPCWYEFQQYQASDTDPQVPRDRARAIVLAFLASPERVAAVGDNRAVAQIQQKVYGREPELALFDLLVLQFNMFRKSDYFALAQHHIARLTARDSSGRYAWDSHPIYELSNPSGDLAIRKKTYDSRRIESSFNPNNMPEGTFVEERALEDATPSPFTSVPTRLPDVSVDQSSHSVEISDLDSLLTYLGQRPDCINAVGDRNLGQPTALPQVFNSGLHECEQLLLQQGQIVNEKEVDRRRNRAESDTWGCVLPERAIRFGKLHCARLFLSHLGWMSYEKNALYQPLDWENSKFKRGMRQLDTTTYGREVTKVGLVYVAPGQEDERSMFRNESGSPTYSEFVEGIASVVSIAEHRAYLGGLDRTGTCGTTLPYFHSSTAELCFHEVVRMPTVQKDPQQILKKRHVGNDIIHLIWDEHSRDYNPQTIVSQFNDAHIMIYPLPNGLFRIQTAQKKEVGPFGPLVHNMVTTKELLPLLARQTALNANQVVRSNQEAYLGQFVGRKDALNDLIKRCAIRKTYNEFLLDLFKLNV